MWADIYSAWKENSHKIRKHATDPCSYPWAIWRCQLTEKAPSITFNKSSSVIPIGWYLIKMSSNLQGFWNTWKKSWPTFGHTKRYLYLIQSKVLFISFPFSLNIVAVWYKKRESSLNVLEILFYNSLLNQIFKIACKTLQLILTI